MLTVQSSPAEVGILCEGGGRSGSAGSGPPHPLQSSPAEASVRRAPELARTSENEWAGPRRCRRL